MSALFVHAPHSGHEAAPAPWSTARGNGTSATPHNGHSEIDSPRVPFAQRGSGEVTVDSERPPLRLSAAQKTKGVLPEDVSLLALPDAELSSRYRVSLAMVAQWRAALSLEHSPWLTHSTTADGTTAGFVASFAPQRVLTAATMLHGRSAVAALAPTNTHLGASPASLAEAVDRLVPHTTHTAQQQTPLSRAPLPIGLPTLDAALLGGLRRGWVMELAGLPNSGKTTLAASWCRHVALHAAASCVWLQSSHCLGAAARTLGAEGSPSTALLDSIHVACVADIPSLHTMLRAWLADPAALRGVGLVVVDSVTELARNSFSFREDDALQRHDDLAALLHTLKRLAEAAGVAVLVVTQQHGKDASPFRGYGVHNSHSSGGTAGGAYLDEDDAGEAWDDAGRTATPRACASSARRGGAHALSSCSPYDEASSLSAGVVVGELGRLFFHNVNVRVQLRDVRRASTAAPTFRPSTLSFSSDASVAAQWQLEVLKCPLCAPLAIPLQLSRSFSCAGAMAADHCHDMLSSSGADALCVVEKSGGSVGTATALSRANEVSGEAFYASVDPWDFTEIPTFLYL